MRACTNDSPQHGGFFIGYVLGLLDGGKLAHLNTPPNSFFSPSKPLLALRDMLVLHRDEMRLKRLKSGKLGT